MYIKIRKIMLGIWLGILLGNRTSFPALCATGKRMDMAIMTACLQFIQLCSYVSLAWTLILLWFMIKEKKAENKSLFIKYLALSFGLWILLPAARVGGFAY